MNELCSSEVQQVTPHLIFHRKLCVFCFHLLSFFLAGEDEEARAKGHSGGDCALGTVLHPAAGKTHLHQLGQGDSSLGSHLSRIQGQLKQFVKIMLRLLTGCFCLFVFLCFFVACQASPHCFCCAGPGVWSVRKL